MSGSGQKLYHWCRVSILIDNYDNPLMMEPYTSATQNEFLMDHMTSFYKEIKTCVEILCTVFITSVSRLNKIHKRHSMLLWMTSHCAMSILVNIGIHMERNNIQLQCSDWRICQGNESRPQWYSEPTSTKVVACSLKLWFEYNQLTASPESQIVKYFQHILWVVPKICTI